MANSTRSDGVVIGRLAGAPILIAPTWWLGGLVLTGLVVGVNGQPTVAAVGQALIFVVLLFASVLAHEVAHGLVGRARGQQPEAIVLTLWGGHTTFREEADSPGTVAVVAVAGPITNLALGMGFLILDYLVPANAVSSILGFAAITNGFVGFFNLIPGLPLDGGQLLEAAVWRGTGRRSTGMVVAGWTGRVVAVGTVAVSLGIPLTYGSRPSLTTVIWSVVIGGFLWTGAGAAIRQGSQLRRLDDLDIAALSHPAVGIPETSSLEDGVSAVRAAGTDRVVAVSDLGVPIGYVDGNAVAAVPADQFPVTPISAVVTPVPAGAVVDETTKGRALLAAARRAAEAGAPVVVVKAGQVLAVIAPEEIAKALDPRLHR